MAYMKALTKFPAGIKAEIQSHYCPGCGHGIVHRMLAEALSELGVRGRTIGVAPVGCSVLAYVYLNVDMVEAPHGRAPAVATGIKRAQPDKVVFTYQGDGDLAAIGTSEIVHAANRGERFTTIFINNAIYGMTGGQMAPTTMVGQRTSTTPYGRRPENDGFPLRVCELLSNCAGAAYLERVSLSAPAKMRKAKKAVRKAFETQLADRGFSLVEVLSPCPTGWGMKPIDALKYVGETMEKIFPPGVYKDLEVPEKELKGE